MLPLCLCLPLTPLWLFIIEPATVLLAKPTFYPLLNGPAGRLRALRLKASIGARGACGCEWVPASRIITGSQTATEAMQLLQLCRLVPDQAERAGDTVRPEPHQARGQALGIPHLTQHCLLRVACGPPRFSVGLSPARRHPRGAERGGQSAAAEGSGR